jgi:hypothetical protein
VAASADKAYTTPDSLQYRFMLHSDMGVLAMGADRPTDAVTTRPAKLKFSHRVRLSSHIVFTTTTRTPMVMLVVLRKHIQGFDRGHT